MARILSPYEIKQLIEHGFDPKKIDEYGEMPVEYITGHVPFRGLDFLISQAALIPRLETEELVELVLTHCLSLVASQASLNIGEIGTGSGAVGISLLWSLLKLPQVPAQINLYLTDVSAAALQVAHQNIHHLLPELTQRTNQGTYQGTINTCQITITVMAADLMTGFPEVQCDVLVANLPYIPTDRINSLDASVKDFEPHVALDGGEQGLSLIHRFLTEAPPYLNPTGHIMLEVDYTHHATDVLPANSAFKATTVFDQFQRQRFAIISWADEHV